MYQRRAGKSGNQGNQGQRDIDQHIGKCRAQEDKFHQIDSTLVESAAANGSRTDTARYCNSHTTGRYLGICEILGYGEATVKSEALPLGHAHFFCLRDQSRQGKEDPSKHSNPQINMPCRLQRF